MDSGLTVLSWNVNGETAVSGSQLRRQLEFFDSECGDVDVFLFQAVRNEPTDAAGWDEHLSAFIEYFEGEPREYHVTHTGDWSQELFESDVQPHAGITSPHNRCNVTVSRWPIERRSLSLRNIGHRKPRGLNYYYSQFPEKILVGEIDTSGDPAVDLDSIEVWNVGIINDSNWGEEKVNMLETVYDRIYLQNKKLDQPLILGGDFNAPQIETSEKEIVPHGGTQYTQYPFYGDPNYFQEPDGEMVESTFGQRWRDAEQQLFDSEVGEWEMQDAYLASSSESYEASTVDYTHIVHNGNPSKKRLDHILVSSDFSVGHCGIWNGRRSRVDGMKGGTGYKSDHAPVVARVQL